MKTPIIFPKPSDDPALLGAVHLKAEDYSLNTGMLFSSNENADTFIRINHYEGSAERFRHAIMTMKQKHSGGVYLDIVVRPIFGMTETEQLSERVKELEAQAVIMRECLTDAKVIMMPHAGNIIVGGLLNRINGALNNEGK